MHVLYISTTLTDECAEPWTKNGLVFICVKITVLRTHKMSQLFESQSSTTCSEKLIMAVYNKNAADQSISSTPLSDFSLSVCCSLLTMTWSLHGSISSPQGGHCATSVCRMKVRTVHDMTRRRPVNNVQNNTTPVCNSNVLHQFLNKHRATLRFCDNKTSTMTTALHSHYQPNIAIVLRSSAIVINCCPSVLNVSVL